MELLDLAESLKSTVTKCQQGNAQLVQILKDMSASNFDHSTYFQYACGDSKNLGRVSSEFSSFQSRLPHEEYLGEAIRIKTQENAALRDSNVKLRQESKIQDQKIRDLNRSLLLQSKMIQKNESQRAMITQLKKTVSDKLEEIRNLTKNLDYVKVSLVKEQKKARCVQEHQKISTPQLKASQKTTGKSKLESLIGQLNQLPIDEELKKLQTYQKANKGFLTEKFLEEIENAQKRLELLKINLKKRQIKSGRGTGKTSVNNQGIAQSACVNSKKCKQVPQNSIATENFPTTYCVKTGEQISCDVTIKEKSGNPRKCA